MSEKNGSEGSYKSLYEEKYEKESQALLERLFKTDHIFRLDGFLLKRYIDVLKKVFGYSQLDGLPENASYLMDKNGYCPEIAEFLNNPNYLFMPPATYYSIVVSPEQQDARLADAPFSFLEECLNSAYKKYDEIIKFLTKDEAAIIQYKFNLRNFDDISKIHRLRSVTMNIDTAGERVADISRLQSLASGLASDDNILSDAYIAEIMEIVKKTGRGVKNIFKKVYVNEISIALQSFYINYPKAIISLFDAANKNTLLFYNKGDYVPAGEPEAGLYPVEISSASVIENLQSLNFIDFHTNPAFILEKAELLEDLFLLEKGYDVNRLSKFELERARSEQSSGMPDIINALHELKGVFERPGVNKKKEIVRMPQEAKYLLAFAKTEFNVVNKLLCLFDAHNFVRRYYSDAGALERELLQMPLAKKYYILKYLSGELRRSDVIND